MDRSARRTGAIRAASVLVCLIAIVRPGSVFGQDEDVPRLPDTVVEAQPPNPSPDFPSQPLDSQQVVTPTRTTEPQGTVASSVTVIRREEILESGQSTVAEVLRGRVGLDVVRQGGPGALTSVFLRGANSQQTKVLLDGIPINDPSNATRGFDFSSLAVENIERIEVLRGPQSVLYGSDAIGGVVNIITRRGDGVTRVRAFGGGGSFGTAEQSASVSGGDEQFYYSLGGSYLHTDGISAASRRRGNTERDRYRNGTVSGRFGWNPPAAASMTGGDVNLDYVFRYSDVDAEIDRFDFFTGLPTDSFPGSNLSRAFYNRVQMQSTHWDGVIEQRVGFNLTNYDRQDTSPFAFVRQFVGQTRQVDWQADTLIADEPMFGNTLTVGASYLQEEAATSARFQQHNSAIYFQDQFVLAERWFTTVGFRWDDYSTAGPAETYRITSLFQIWETGTSLVGTIGTGFRAPALAENLFQFGNPNLRPEQSRGWDVGARQQLDFCCGEMNLSAVYFRNDFRDLIVFDFNTFALENVGVARASGVELEWFWRVNRCTSFAATYTLTATRDQSTGLALLRRPRDKASLAAHHRFWCGRAAVHGYLNYVGPRLDTRSTRLAEYYLLNLAGSYQLSDAWTVTGRLDNVLNDQYEEVAGFGTPGFSGYAGLVFQY